MRILVFGDEYGVPQTIRHLPRGVLVGIAAAEVRPHKHPELRRLADSLRVPLLIQSRNTSPAHPAFIERVRALVPDLILVNSYSMIIHPEVLAIPRLGAVNIHGALLPQYRGANPTQWALLNGEVETGVTMHHMIAEVDAGDIIAQRRVAIYFEDTWRDIQARTASATDAMLAEELPKLLNGMATRQPQDQSRACRYQRRHPEDGRIDWRQSVMHIYNLVRALVKPHPGAFYGDGADKVVLDQYLTIPQVTSLKYGGAGAQMLASRQVSLNPLRVADLPVVFECMDDPQRALFNSPYKPFDSADEAWFDTLLKRNDVVIFGIRLLATDTLIGFCHLHGINYTHRTADLYVHLRDIAEGNLGYAEDATRLLLDFAFRDLTLHRLCSRVLASDHDGVRMYETVGFVREGLLRAAAHIDGHYVDVIVMGILQEHYGVG